MIKSMLTNTDAAETVEWPTLPAKRAAPSPWIWLPYIWLFIASTRALSSWLSIGVGSDTPDLEADVSGSFLDRTVLQGLMALGLVVLGRRAERTKTILARNKWLVMLFIYMGLSVLWSNFPAISLRRWFRLLGTLIMALVALTEQSPLEALRALFRRLYLLHIPLSIITIKYFRNIGVAWSRDGSEVSWVGLAVHKNNLGQVAMCSGLVSTWQVLQNWSRKKLTVDLALLVLTLWVLRGPPTARSSTSIIGFIVGALVLFGLQPMRKRPGKVVRGARILGAVAVVALAVMPVFEAIEWNPLEVVVESSGRDMTFTGRTGLWKDVLNNAAKNPVLGVGIGAFWVGPIGYAMYPLENWSRVTPRWRPGQGHNGYVDVCVDLGAIGILLVVIVIGYAFAGALADFKKNFELGRLRLTLLVSIVLNNITESSLLKGTHSLWFLFLLVAINVPTKKVTGCDRRAEILER